MDCYFNEYGQPIGAPLLGWTERRLPAEITLRGEFCYLEPLNLERHAHDLYDAYTSADDDRDWTYLPIGPFHSEEEYFGFVRYASTSTDTKHYAVVDSRLKQPVGTIALMRADIQSGSIEVGWVIFSPLLKRKPASTEAQFLLMQYVFEGLGYRRYEWKCDNLNAPSRQAALRLGFTFEGVFRQAAVYKERSRDTAWFSVIDKEWPSLKRAFIEWLTPNNFDRNGCQVKSLSEIRTR